MRRIWAAVFPYRSIILAALLLLIAFVYVQLSRLLFDRDNILYGLIFFFHVTGPYVLLLTIVSLCLWFIRVFNRIKDYSTRQTLIALAAGILFFVAVPVSGWANTKLFTQLGTEFTHVSQVRIQDHLFQLALIWNWNFSGGASYNVYRCDSIGLACDRIHQMVLTEEIVRSSSEFQAATTATLVSDPNGDTISIQVNGETIHTMSI